MNCDNWKIGIAPLLSLEWFIPARLRYHLLIILRKAEEGKLEIQRKSL